MKIFNTNVLYEKSMVKEIAAFVTPPGVSGFDIMLKGSKSSYGGRAYYNGSGYHCSANPFISLRISKMRFPYKTYGKGAYIGCTLYNQTEALVFLMAHELRHLWQKKVKRGWRVWGSRGQYSERDADAYAIHKVREWRRK